MAGSTENGIQEILSQEDIEGLLALGAPRDEYEREAQLIYRAITDFGPTAHGGDTARDAVKSILRAVWSERFGPFSEDDLARRDPAFERAATRIAALPLE